MTILSSHYHSTNCNFEFELHRFHLSNNHRLLTTRPGIQNFGNSCFFSASIQSLFHSSAFVYYFYWDLDHCPYNNLYPKTVSNYELCLMHIEDFSNAYENNIEEAYSVLDQGYKDKRFKNVNDFKELLDERKKITYFSSFSEYMVNNYSNYTEYVCKDQYGYIYIFKEEYPMQYTLQLDTYTIPTDKFKEEYEIGNEQTKVQMNINKNQLLVIG